MCDLHFYAGDYKTPPTRGCADCWRAYFFTGLANTPPERQKQWLEEAEEVVHKLVEAVEKKRNKDLGFTLYEHPVVEIQKGVADEDLEKET